MKFDNTNSCIWEDLIPQTPKICLFSINQLHLSSNSNLTQAGKSNLINLLSSVCQTWITQEVYSIQIGHCLPTEAFSCVLQERCKNLNKFVHFNKCVDIYQDVRDSSEDHDHKFELTHLAAGLCFYLA